MDSVRMSDLRAKEFTDVGDLERIMAANTDPTAPSTNEPRREERNGGVTTTHCKFVLTGGFYYLFIFKVCISNLNFEV